MLNFDIPSADTKKQATVGNGGDGQQRFGQWAHSPQNISSIYSTYWWCGDVIPCTQNRSCAFPSFRLSRWRARLAAREPPGALSWKEILHQVIINRRFLHPKVVQDFFHTVGWKNGTSMVWKLLKFPLTRGHCEHTVWALCHLGIYI